MEWRRRCVTCCEVVCEMLCRRVVCGVEEEDRGARKEGRKEGRKEVGGAAKNTRTPHNNVGNYTFFNKRKT